MIALDQMGCRAELGTICSNLYLNTWGLDQQKGLQVIKFLNVQTANLINNCFSFEQFLGQVCRLKP
ncbi:MAG: hypothetical protein DCF32_13145 [Leptolyngbya sp.]|nr:MAG: hypothetical protein DCF32_13145 [Leptolyngbya sp.]